MYHVKRMNVLGFFFCHQWLCVVQVDDEGNCSSEITNSAQRDLSYSRTIAWCQTVRIKHIFCQRLISQSQKSGILIGIFHSRYAYTGASYFYFHILDVCLLIVFKFYRVSFQIILNRCFYLQDAHRAIDLLFGLHKMHTHPYMSNFSRKWSYCVEYVRSIVNNCVASNICLVNGDCVYLIHS